MAFQDIVKVEKPDTYLDIAFRSGRDKINITRQKVKGPKLERSKTIELERVKAVRKYLVNSLDKIIKSFPSFESMPEFYKELAKCTIDYPETKRSLGAINWAKNQVEKFYKIYSTKIKGARDISLINNYRREFYGRVSSIIKQINTELEILENSRRIIREYPVIKTDLFTVALFGFPNVGKTTLLSKLSSSKPEIAAYPFTTKDINIGYARQDSKKIQLLDTPGTLNRFNKMNNIEKQAILVIKHVANLVVYIFDLTEPYPLEEQKKLFQNLKDIKKQMVVYLSKSDTLNKTIVENFKKEIDAFTDAKKLKDYLFSLT